jgi:hypothetical protein
MNLFALLAIAAALGAVLALACGIAAMATDGAVIHRRSEAWMGWRVACQAAALLFAAVMLATSAQSAAPERTDCIYDYRMITDQECRAYRAKVLRAKSEEERLALHDELHRVIDARARERGVSPDDWRGLAIAPPSPSGRASAPAAGIGLETAVLMVGLAAVVTIAFFVGHALWPVRRLRLMRCPETGTIAFVSAASMSRGEGKAPAIAVRSCELWPRRQHCARGCLERYEEATPGYRAKIEALRPFSQP